MEVWAKKLEWLRWSWVFCTVKLKLPATLKHSYILFTTTQWTAAALATGSDVAASLLAQSSKKTYRIGEYMERWSIKMKECESKKADFSSCSGCVRNKSDSLHRKHLWTEDWSGWEKNKSYTSHMGIVCGHSKDRTHLLYPSILDADWWAIHSGVSDNEI